MYVYCGFRMVTDLILFPLVLYNFSEKIQFLCFTFSSVLAFDVVRVSREVYVEYEVGSACCIQQLEL